MNEYMRKLLAAMKRAEVEAERLGYTVLSKRLSEDIAKLRSQNDPTFSQIDVQSVMAQTKDLRNRRVH